MNPKDWSPGKVAVKVNAGHDVNGNPRRGWIVLSCKSGDMVDFVDEGYEGDSKLRRKHPTAAVGPTIKVVPGEYRQLKKEGSKSPGMGCGPCGSERRSTMAKKSVPPVLMAWVHCRKASGVKPGVKMTGRQKIDARACVMREMRNKMAGKKR